MNRLSEMRLPVFRSEPRELEDIARTIERLGALAGVFYEEWDRPLMTVNGDHVISKVIRLCGGENVFADLPLIAPEIDVEAVLRANPEVIISSGASLDALEDLLSLAAVKNGALRTIPSALIQRRTPRILKGAERMCAILDGVRKTR